MNLRRFRFLADENIHTDVVSFLRDLGCDVLDVREQEWSGRDDISLIHEAVQDNRVVLTHDSDFGALAVAAGEPIVGIIYLRPGHIRSLFTIESLQTLLSQEREVESPFLIVVDRRGSAVRIRVREL